MVLIACFSSGHLLTTNRFFDFSVSSNRLCVCLAVSLSCFLGFAGVYFEKVLKGETAGIWVMNVQLASFSILIAFVSLMYRDSETSKEHYRTLPMLFLTCLVMQQGFFYGYNNWAFAAISLQAFGGLVVAVVVKYADNILKVSLETCLCPLSLYLYLLLLCLALLFSV